MKTLQDVYNRIYSKIFKRNVYVLDNNGEEYFINGVYSSIKFNPANRISKELAQQLIEGFDNKRIVTFDANEILKLIAIQRNGKLDKI